MTICKLTKEAKISSIRIGRVWRFDKEVIDKGSQEAKRNNIRRPLLEGYRVAYIRSLKKCGFRVNQRDAAFVVYLLWKQGVGCSNPLIEM